ncbi:MAG: hypothetical protein JJT78_16310 [Leptospira sp.]|nr:hypothetical protein [Leptospira sp.]
MEARSSLASKKYQPFPHRDPYGLDSMYISPLSEAEIWDISSFHKAELLSFSFLALRSVVYEKQFQKSLEIKNPSLEFRKSLGRKNWDLHLLPASWRAVFPQIIQESEDKKHPFPLDIPLELRFDWEDGKEKAGMGIIPEFSEEVFPRILDALIGVPHARVYLRTSRQSFLYIPSLGEESKKGLFIQDKESYGFPEFYYYWLTL